MPGILDMICDDLPPTATHARRSFVWIPGGADGRLGTLTIVLQGSRRAGAKQESDTYAIDEDTEPLNQAARAMLLLNESDPKQADVYKVTTGSVWRCTCKAGLCRVPCKHIASLRAVIDAGGLEG
jgi:hypothetical protein